MLFSLLKHYLELYVTDTAVKVSTGRSLYCKLLLLYFIALKTISPGCGVRASLMLLFSISFSLKRFCIKALRKAFVLSVFTVSFWCIQPLRNVKTLPQVVDFATEEVIN